MQDELTAKMHSEFTISDDMEIRNRALSVWSMCGYDREHPKFKHYCEIYGLTQNQALMWYVFWKRLHDSSKKR